MNLYLKSCVLLSFYSNQLMWNILKQFDRDVKHKFTLHFVQSTCGVVLHPESLNRIYFWLYPSRSILSPRIALFGINLNLARPAFLLFNLSG